MSDHPQPQTCSKPEVKAYPGNPKIQRITLVTLVTLVIVSCGLSSSRLARVSEGGDQRFMEAWVALPERYCCFVCVGMCTLSCAETIPVMVVQARHYRAHAFVPMPLCNSAHTFVCAHTFVPIPLCPYLCAHTCAHAFVPTPLCPCLCAHTFLCNRDCCHVICRVGQNRI